MQLTAQAVLASIVISGALAAPVPGKWPGQTGFDKDGKPKAVGGTQFLADHGAKIGGGLAIAGAAGGLAGGIITSQNRRDVEVELAARTLSRVNSSPARIQGNHEAGPKPAPLDIKTPKPDKNGAINAGIGAAGAGLGAVGAGFAIANAVNGRREVASELFELERRLTPANLALGALMSSGVSVNHADGNQQSWQTAGKSSGAASRRDVDETLSRRLINVGSNHQDQNVQGGGSGPNESGTNSGGSSAAFWSAAAAGNQPSGGGSGRIAAQRQQKRLINVGSNHQDQNVQGGGSGPNESGTNSGGSSAAFWSAAAAGNQPSGGGSGRIAAQRQQKRLINVGSNHQDQNVQGGGSGPKQSQTNSGGSSDAFWTQAAYGNTNTPLPQRRLFGVTSTHIDTNDQEWMTGPKISGASSRRDVDADLLGKRLFGVTSTHIDQNQQGWQTMGKSSGAMSRRDLGRRLFGVTSTHIDTNDQEWTTGGKSAFASS